MAAVAGPPAGNVPLVAWPSVCADQAAGAISSAPMTAPSAIARFGRNASAAAAATPTAISTPGSQARESGLSCRIATSAATPASTATGASTRATCRPQ